MDNLQYVVTTEENEITLERFKPYYKWITFNTPNDVAVITKLISFKAY